MHNVVLRKLLQQHCLAPLLFSEIWGIHRLVLIIKAENSDNTLKNEGI